MEHNPQTEDSYLLEETHVIQINCSYHSVCACGCFSDSDFHCILCQEMGDTVSPGVIQRYNVKQGPTGCKAHQGFPKGTKI